MKKLVVTRADSKITEMTEITHPVISSYAERCGADFKVLTKDSDCTVGHGKWHFKILQLNELLDDYDRIICIDSDVLIKNSCPDLFDVVPYECVGTNLEDKGSRANNRHGRINLANQLFGDNGWREKYINTGVFVVSKPHQNIFNKIDGKYAEDAGFQGGFDDVQLGYLIQKHGHCIHELDYKFNHMTMHSEDWNGNANRFESYIIHYAGAGIFDSDSRINQIKMDRKILIENGEL